MQVLGRVLVAKAWPSNEERYVFITEGWTETAWREYCQTYLLDPLYIVSIRRK